VQTINTTSLKGTELSFEFPDSPFQESQFCLALHKSGSVLFYNLIEEMAQAVGKPCFALETELFTRGVALVDCPLELMQMLERPGYVFHGFRTQWILQYVRQFRNSRKLILVRDPRDIAVSYYFSVTKSHTIPDSGDVRDKMLEQRQQANQIDINTFVKSGRCDFVLNNMRNFSRLVDSDELCRVYRYEDVIFKKREWVADINKVCGFDLDTGILNEIADRHDIRPDSERPDSHIRQVSPGNFRKHLDQDAQNSLERRFRPVFDFFGYQTETLD
jgi:hypothetical protein